MPLPSNSQTPWPPKDLELVYDKFREWAAWYSGDPARLREVYAGLAPDGQAGRPWYRFWARAARAEPDQKATMHVPVAGDLTSVSAGLLFGEEPRLWVVEAHAETAPAGAKAAEKRLGEIVAGGGVYNRLLEAAETASAMGGVYLHPVWDKELADHPLVGVSQADAAVPEFRFGLLVAVTFHEVVERDGNVVTRHLERHERTSVGNSVILHAFYVGSDVVLGRRLDDAYTQARGYQPRVELPFPELDVEYVPNRRPNRLWRSRSEGISDFSGSETVLDGIDETYASWMRDIRLAKARIIAPREFLDEDGNFDVDHEVFTGVTMEPGAAEQGQRSMMANQFAIRYLEHQNTILELIERTVSNAGYSPQSFGIRIEGRAESGTALRVRENKTTLTRARKSQWWTPAISRLAFHLLAIDKEVFKTPLSLDEVTVSADLSTSATRDQVELANTVNTIKAAQAASIRTRVKMLHPEWSKEEVDTEVELIKEEEGVGQVPDPTALGGAGNGDFGEEADSPPTDEGEAPPPGE